MITNLGMRASLSPNDAVNECIAAQRDDYLRIGWGRYFCASRMSVALLLGGGGGGGGCWYCGGMPLGVGAGTFVTTGTKCWNVVFVTCGRGTGVVACILSSVFVAPTTLGLGGPTEADILRALSNWFILTDVPAELVPPNRFLFAGISFLVASLSPDCPVAGAGDPVALFFPPTWMVIFLGWCPGVSAVGGSFNLILG